MLSLTIPSVESFDDATQRFIYSDEVTFEIEHSLVSLSKWETVWEKPFLGPTPKTSEEILSYIQLMNLTPNVPPEIFQSLSDIQLKLINQYITAKMSATWFTEKNPKNSNEVITAEIIYYWMISLNIPFECENWHLNRLFTLIKVCNEKNAPEKKMSKRDSVQQRKEINAARKAKLNTNG
jgi:hypothetical protein